VDSQQTSGSYVRSPDNTLWVSKSDGQEARRIETPLFDDLELPRWSPDQKLIAFMAKESDKPYRIHVDMVEGGRTQQVSEESDDPTAEWTIQQLREGS
jgi:Tol biopolymer transport system component